MSKRQKRTHGIAPLKQKMAAATQLGAQKYNREKSPEERSVKPPTKSKKKFSEKVMSMQYQW